MGFSVGDKVFYPVKQAKGLVQAVIEQDGRKAVPWYEVNLVGHGLYSIPQGSLEPFKGQKKAKNLGTKNSPICAKSPLDASIIKTRVSVHREFKPVPGAGIYTPEDLHILMERYNGAISNPKTEKPAKPFIRVTIANATQEQVRDALHKALVRKRARLG